LAAEGARVVVNDLGGEWDGTGADNRPAQLAADEITALGGEAVANYDDVADWEGGQRLVNQAIETWGRLDILVCNAGILRDRTIFNMTIDEWDAVIRVHLRGHFVPARWATAYWRERSKEIGGPVHGRVIMTASESGLYGNAGQTNYAAAKAGIASMGIAAAREMTRYGVTVNVISPRARTRLTENTFGAVGTAGTGFDLWHADNVAPFVAWLCTDAAADVTGQNFVVGGGTVQVMKGWTPTGQIVRDARWTLDALDDAAATLFASHGRGLPRFDMPEMS